MMKTIMKKLLVTTMAVICLAAPAQAQFGRLLPPRNANQGYKTALDMLHLCAVNDEGQLLECLGFIEGVNDALVNTRAAAHLPPCYPADAKVDQIVIQQNFIAYMVAHPEKRPMQGAQAMTESITTRWCPN